MVRSSGHPGADSAQTKTDLHKRVVKARLEYEVAKTEAEGLLDTARNLGLRNTDGVTAIDKASRIQAVATKRYADALKDFADFILSHEPPKHGRL